MEMSNILVRLTGHLDVENNPSDVFRHRQSQVFFAIQKYFRFSVVEINIRRVRHGQRYRPTAFIVRTVLFDRQIPFLSNFKNRNIIINAKKPRENNNDDDNATHL